MRYKLDEHNIDTVCKEANAYLVNRKTNPKDLVHAKLSMEEVLLTYLSAFGSDAEFSVDYGGGLTKNKILLTVPGPSLDPFASIEAESGDDLFLSNVLARMGQQPRWNYVRGVNTILYTTTKKSLPNWGKLLIAIISAIVLGLAARALPAVTAMALQRDMLEPLLHTFIGFLNAIAGPMIFLSIVWGIFSIGDVSTFSEMGRHACVRFLLYLCVSAILIWPISLLFFNLTVGEAQNSNTYSVLYQMILGIIPDNLITPFSLGNTSQIMFIGVVIGIMMLATGKNIQAVADLVEQIGFIIDGVMGVVSKIIPFFVFGSLFSLVASSDPDSLASGGKFFIGTVASYIIVMLIHTIATCVKTRMSPFALWKRTFSTFIIALTTASSSAAFAENKKTCIERLGVSRRMANFGVPFGQILYKPGEAMLYWFAAISVAESSGAQVSTVWFVTAAIMCIILSTASAPVPGGVTAGFTILFSQLSLPLSDLAIIVSLASILDFIMTATNVYSRQCVLVITARSIEKNKPQK